MGMGSTMDLLARLNSEDLPFAKLLGITFTHAELERVVAEMVVRRASAGCLPTLCAASSAGVEPGTRFSLETALQRTSGTNHTQPPQVWLRGGFPAVGGRPVGQLPRAPS